MHVMTKTKPPTYQKLSRQRSRIDLVTSRVAGKVEIDPLDERLRAPVGLVELHHLHTLKIGKRQEGVHREYTTQTHTGGAHEQENERWI